jgi:uncharacterized protein (DUF1501 family)
MSTRRNFLKTTGFIGASSFIPSVFSLGTKTEFAGKRLIVIQLSGGNDWLNTIVPYRNDLYYKDRPRLALQKGDFESLDDQLGMNRVMNPLLDLFSNGEMAIYQGVGYPEPNRSHFRSMDIWHTATDSKSYSTQGWLGKWSGMSNLNFPSLEVNDQLSLAMKAHQGKSLAVSNLNGIKRIRNDKVLQAISHSAQHDHEMASYLYQTSVRVTEGAEFLGDLIQNDLHANGYPKNALGKDLKMIAQLIKQDAETRVFYTSLSGFDTHANQKAQQNRLLENLSEGIRALRNDLKSNSFWRDSLVMVFSEFGRRVAQNAGGGTDHGTAGNLFLIGGSLKNPGIQGHMPSLSDLDEGDLKFNTDFRSIYGGILRDWLECPNHAEILNGYKAAIGI